MTPEQKLFIQLVYEPQNFKILKTICSRYTKTTEDKKDAIQESILEAWKSFPTLKEEHKFSGWLAKIAKLTCIDAFRKAKQAASNVLEHNYLYETIDRAQVVRNYSFREAVLAKAISQLDGGDQDIIYLYLDRVDSETAGAMLGITPNYYRVKFKRAKEKLIKKAYYIIKNTDE